MIQLLQHLRRRAVNERGAVLIFVAVGLPMFVGFGILVVDVGNWWVHKRHLQTQADAAALAGAREFRFPVCSDKAIVEEAVDYSGGVLADPDANYAAFDGNPLNYNHQLAASARPAGPTQGIHAQVNTPDPWDGQYPADRENDGKWIDDDPGDPDDGDLKDMLAANRKPCSSQMVDVKMTETDIAGRFSPLRFLNVLGFIKFIDARARAELHALTAAKDTLPLGVEDLNPKRVHVSLYDEDTQTLVGDAELNPRVPEDGLLMYDNSTAGGGTPMTVDFKRATIGGVDVTKQRIGARIAISGTDSVTCGAAGVRCYGTAGDGLTRIRGARTTEGTSGVASCTDGVDNDADGTSDNNDQDCRGVRLGAVALLKDPANCASSSYGTHDNGYFSTTCTKAKLVVDLPGFPGANETSNTMSVTADIQSGNGTSSVALHWVTADSRWETTGSDRLPIELALGTRKIDIRWAQRRNNSTLDMGGASPAVCKSAQNQNPCQGTFTNAHKAFSGTRLVSGPIKEVRVDVGGITNVNNVQRCASNQTCPQAVVVRVGLAGRLDISPPDAPPIGLRIFDSGPEAYSTQQLNCQPNGNSKDELAYGCDPLYGIKDDLDPCPTKATLHASPNPPAWECVAVKPGTMNSVAGGLNERFLCVPPNAASNCGGRFGKPLECTSPNRYPNYDDGDPRILTLFLVPFGSLDVAAGQTVPISNFAFFYVTGWHSKGGGFDNPCAVASAPIPDVFAPGTANDAGVVSGYFIKYVASNNGGSSDAACDPDSIGGCVAAMTK